VKRRVVITGLGIVSPVGNSVESAWDNIVNGRSGVGRITRFDPSAFNAQIAGEVKDFDVTHYMAAKEAKTMDTFIHYGVAAGVQAWKDSGLEITEANADRVGVIVGSGIGGLPRIEETQIDYLDRGPRRISPFFVPASLINLVSGQLSIMLGLKGPSYAVVSACTTGLHSIGDAARLIKYGDADVMIAGGAEAAICPVGIAGFIACRAMSTDFNDAPEKASRPYDKDRDGFVMGEGAGVLVLEEYEHAKARGAKIYAEVAGYGLAGDAYHITAPAEDGDGGFRAMRAAIKDADISPADIDYVNAHGTSTPLGDEIELGAVTRLLGNAAKDLTMSSTKSATGHLLGAAGAIESAFTVLAIRDQIAPPTINLDNPSVETEIDLVPHKAKPMKIDVALSNSFGFGGTNASVVFKKVS